MAESSCFWFGTIEFPQWIPSPMRSFDSSPEGWGADGILLGGGGWANQSWDSRKSYTFEWHPASTPQAAALLKSYRDGTYGRGFLYFLDPTIYLTNAMPSRWADPSKTIDEGSSLVYGVDPTPVPTPSWQNLRLPITSASYSLNSVTPGFRGQDDAVFIPIPKDYTLFLGAFYTFTGTGGVYYTEQFTSGATGTTEKFTALNPGGSTVVQDRLAWRDGLSGVWVWIGRSSAIASSAVVSAITARFLPTSSTATYGPWVTSAVNYYTNPLLNGSTPVEVRRNHWRYTADAPTGTIGWAGSRSTIANMGGYLRTTVNEANPASASTGAVMSSSILHMSPTVAGEPWSGAVEVRQSGGANGAMAIQFFDAANIYIVGSQVVGTVVPTSETEWTTLFVANAVAPPTAVYARALVYRMAGGAVGDWLDFRRVTGEKFSVAPPYAYTGNHSPDPDLTPAWATTPNAGESFLRGVGISGATFTNAAAVRSSQFGGSVRLIPTSTTSNISFAMILVPVPVRPGGVAKVTQHQLGEITGSTWSDRGIPYVRDPKQPMGPPSPNAAGSTDFSASYTALTSATPEMVLTHGGMRGSGDVYYTRPGMFTIGYDGPWFSGDTVSTSDTVRYLWSGEPGNSTSERQTRQRVGDSSGEWQVVNGPWVGGMGHSGARFRGVPTYASNSMIDDGQVSFAASFVEVGSWAFG